MLQCRYVIVIRNIRLFKKNATIKLTKKKWQEYILCVRCLSSFHIKTTNWDECVSFSVHSLLLFVYRCTHTHFFVPCHSFHFILQMKKALWWATQMEYATMNNIMFLLLLKLQLNVERRLNLHKKKYDEIRRKKNVMENSSNLFIFHSLQNKSIN